MRVLEKRGLRNGFWGPLTLRIRENEKEPTKENEDGMINGRNMKGTGSQL